MGVRLSGSFRHNTTRCLGGVLDGALSVPVLMHGARVSAVLGVKLAAELKDQRVPVQKSVHPRSTLF